MVAILSHYLPLNSVYPKVTSKYKKKYGLIDSSNKVILPLIYDEIKPFPNEQILTTVKKEGKYGVIAINGYEIVKPICDSIKIDFDKISGKYVITHDTSRTKSFTADQIIQLIKNNAQNFISGIDSLVDKPILNIQNPKFESE